MLTRFFTTKELMILAGIGVAVCIGGIAVLVARHTAPAEVLVTQNTPDSQPGAELPSATPYPSEPISVPEPQPAPESVAASPSEPAKVVVSVMGEVLSPGVYTLPDTARVDDLIDAAGGATESADFTDINRAALLIDASTLTIPSRAPASSSDGRIRIRRPAPAPPVNPPQYTISGWQPPVEAPHSSSGAPGVRGALQANTSGMIDLNRATVDQLQTLPGIGPKYAEAIVAYRTQRPFSSVEDLQNVRGIGPKRMESLRSLVTVTH